MKKIKSISTVIYFLAAILLTDSVYGQGNIIHIYPGDSFEQAAENLNPGETLIVHEGTYNEANKVSITVQGTTSNPVLIKGADGEAKPKITRPDSSENALNIDGATYLTLKGLEVYGGNEGVNIYGFAHDVAIEDMDVHDTGIGINLKSNLTRIYVRNNNLHDLGYHDTGEGIYIGCNYGTCIINESIFENNWIHDTSLESSQGDGIELKEGSHSNIIRDNVIYNTRWPCILVYGTAGNPKNIVEGNVVWNCGDSGIQAAADVIIRNNIILNSPENGFNSQIHQNSIPSNLEFVHNTIVGGDPCLRLMDWNNRQGIVFANNAIYCPSGNFNIPGITGVTSSGNVFTPAITQFPSNGFIVGNSISQDFVDEINKNLYPSSSSALIDAGDINYAVTDDFNVNPRTGSPDAGAYDFSTINNPGWIVTEGFKNIEPLPCQDNDGDGYSGEGGSCGAVDCDDTDSSVNPGATEGPFGDPTCSDLKDNDCNSLTDVNDPVCERWPTDMGIYRNGYWYLDDNGTLGWNAGDTRIKFGRATDIPVAGDWNGDGFTDMGVFRDGEWLLDSSGTPGWNKGDTRIKFGMAGDIPVTGDWDGDGYTDIGIYRNGWWYLDDNGTPGWNAGDTRIKFGRATDIPVAGDWNGDGFTDMGVFRDGEWLLDSNGTPGWNKGDTRIKFGMAGDIPVTGDWDGDGYIDIGIFRDGWWSLDSNGTPGWNKGDTHIKFGIAGDIPVSGMW